MSFSLDDLTPEEISRRLELALGQPWMTAEQDAPFPHERFKGEPRPAAVLIPSRVCWRRSSPNKPAVLLSSKTAPVAAGWWGLIWWRRLRLMAIRC